jgi:hypothetical protein
MIISGAIGHRPSAPKTSDRAIDQRWFFGALVPSSQPLQLNAAFDHDLGLAADQHTIGIIGVG